MSNRADVRIVRSIDELEQLAQEWAALSSRFSTPLLNHDWFTCAAAAFHQESDLRVVTVREQGVLKGVAPMAIDPVHRHLVLIGSTSLYEPSGWIYADEDALRALSRAVVALGDVAILNRVDAQGGMIDMVSRTVRWHAITFARDSGASYSVPTNGGWNSYLATLSARTRRELASAEAKARSEYGEVRFTRLEPAPDEAEVALELLVRIEATGWKGKNGSSLSSRPALLHFFRSYLARAAAERRARVAALWFGDTMAATEIGVEAYGRMWGLKLAYDERFAKFAPAVQLIHASIAAAAHRSLESYEFLGAAEQWQQRWHPVTRRYQVAALYPMSGRAVATAVMDATGFLARRLRRQAHSS